MVKRVSASFCKGKGSIAHNNREFITPNVDKERIDQNIIYQQESLEEAYRHLFGEAVEKYNAKQKRADRKIGDYMDHIRTSKNGEKLFYENVVQVGTMFSCNVRTEDGAVAAKILDEYMKDFQSRNPNLYVFNAVMHLDEQTPHLHIDYIPIATGYKNGLQVRNSLDKALKQQGIDGTGGKRGNSTQNWQKRERDCLALIIERNGWEYTQPKGLNRSNLSLSQYKAMTSEIENQVAVLPEQITATQVPLSKDKVIVSKEDLDRLEERAKLIQVHEDVIGNLEAYHEEKEIEIDFYVNEIKQKADQEAQKILEAAKKKMEDAERDSVSAFALKQNLGRELVDIRLARENYEKLYREQLGLNQENQRLKSAMKEKDTIIDNLKAENNILKGEISSLKTKIKDIVTEVQLTQKEWEKQLSNYKNIMSEIIRSLCEEIKDICEAVAMLKYDTEQGYRINLNQKQGRLIDAISNRGSNRVREEGYAEMANDIDRHIGISESIKSEIKKIERKNEMNRNR